MGNYLYWWWTFQHGRTVLFVVTLQFPAYNAPMEGVKLRKLKPGKKQYVPSSNGFCENKFLGIFSLQQNVFTNIPLVYKMAENTKRKKFINKRV
jgi:hypothetical protein